MSGRLPRLVRALVLSMALAITACTSVSPSPRASTVNVGTPLATPTARLTITVSSPSKTAPSATATSATTPTPAAQATAVSEDWITVAPTMGMPESVDWAPDGEHLLLETSVPKAGIYYLGLDLVDAQGNVVRWYPGFGLAAWLDAGRFVAYSEKDEKPGTDFKPDQAWVMDTDGGDPQPIDIPFGTFGPLGNGHGALAFQHVLPDVNNTWRDNFVVWADGITSTRHDGYPQRWSADGTKLEVIHPFKQSGGEGWPEIVSWPGLRTLFEAPPPEQTDASFDPTGAYIAYEHDEENGGQDLSTIRVVTLATGGYVDLPYANDDFWANGYLNTIEAQTLREYDTRGNLVNSARAPGVAGFPSADGSSIAFLSDDYGTGPTLDLNVVVERGGTLSALKLPAEWSNLRDALAPDGSALAIAGDNAVYIHEL